MPQSHPKTLFFDVFGTLFNWRPTITQSLQSAASRTPQHDTTTISWPDFASQWRQEYIHHMVHTAQTQTPSQWIDVDTLHRQILDSLCTKYGIEWDDKLRNELVMAWHRLEPWEDVPTGMKRLKKGFMTSSLSNGTVRLLVDLAKGGNVSFDMILSAELFRAYKPDLRVYKGAAELLGVETGECLMVAAHALDLEKARECGMRTAFVFRVGEGVEKVEDVEGMGFDFVVGGLEELADALGCE